MGFFDDLKSAFSGGSSKKSSASSGSKDKSSTPTFKSLSEAAKAGYHGQAVNIAGKGKQKVSFGDKSYDKKMAAASNAASGSGGIKSLGTALKNAPKNIARDVGMGVGLTKRDADYYRRTANTIARTQGAAAADRYIKQMSAKGGDAAAGVKLANVADAVNYGQRIGMLNKDGSVNKNYMSSDDGGLPSLANTETDDMSDQYAENLRRYNEYMEQQNQQPTEITPDMRQAALQIFESQQGAGQVPYYMAAARNAQNPNMSPAFQYAAQNYDVLGGSQRLGPRPMEMMSVAERRQINDMAQGMADRKERSIPQIPPGFRDIAVGGGGKGGPRIAPQQGGGFNSMEELMEYQRRNPTANLMGEYQRLKALEAGSQQAAADDYQAGMDMVMRGGGKGGPRTGPQIPPMRQPLSRQPVPFASMLASRFGGFGG